MIDETFCISLQEIWRCYDVMQIHRFEVGSHGAREGHGVGNATKSVMRIQFRCRLLTKTISVVCHACHLCSYLCFSSFEMFLSCRDRPLQILLLLSQIRGAASHGAFPMDLLATRQLMNSWHSTVTGGM